MAAWRAARRAMRAEAVRTRIRRRITRTQAAEAEATEARADSVAIRGGPISARAGKGDLHFRRRLTALRSAVEAARARGMIRPGTIRRAAGRRVEESFSFAPIT